MFYVTVIEIHAGWGCKNEGKEIKFTHIILVKNMTSKKYIDILLQVESKEWSIPQGNA